MRIQTEAADPIVCTLTCELTAREIKTLASVLGNVCGDSNGPREVVDRVYHELCQHCGGEQDLYWGSGTVNLKDVW